MLGEYFSLLTGEYHTFSPCISGLLTDTLMATHTHTHVVIPELVPRVLQKVRTILDVAFFSGCPVEVRNARRHKGSTKSAPFQRDL